MHLSVGMNTVKNETVLYNIATIEMVHNNGIFRVPFSLL